MPLGENLRRLLTSMDLELSRVLDSPYGRVNHDNVSWNEVACTLRYYRNGELVRTLRGEAIGSYSPELGIYRWGWTARSVKAPPKQQIDQAFREGHKLSLPELTSETVQLESEDDARKLSAFAAVIANAISVVSIEDGTRMGFIAVFGDVEHPAPPASDDQSRAVRLPPYTVPPLPPKSSRPPSVLPPPSPPPIGGLVNPFPKRPRTSAPPPPEAREPPRELFLPVAQRALSTLDFAHPGFREALIVITKEADGPRFSLELVATARDGRLVAVDPPRELIEAAARMTNAEAGGKFRRLIARLVPSERGASVDVEVK